MSFIAHNLFGLIGTLFGSIGTFLGIVSFLKDRPNLQIELLWDMEPFGDSLIKKYDPKKTWGVIKVSPIGRRPTSIKNVYIEIDQVILISSDYAQSEKIQEGDAPKIYPVLQERLEKYADKWRKMRAVVISSSGKKYRSKKLKKMPPWCK